MAMRTEERVCARPGKSSLDRTTDNDFPRQHTILAAPACRLVRSREEGQGRGGEVGGGAEPGRSGLTHLTITNPYQNRTLRLLQQRHSML